MTSKNHEVLRVCRTKAQAKKAYDKISRFYDYFAGVFEKKYRAGHWNYWVLKKEKLC